MKNFREIPQFTNQAFKELCDGNSAKLKTIFEKKKEIENNINNKQLAEIFWNDFAVEWNKLQSSSFIKENVLLDTGKKIPYFASQWIAEWKESFLKEEFSKNIEDVFDLRQFSFETYQLNVDKLKVIFSKVFKATEKDFKNCLNIKSNMVSAYLYDANAKSNRDALAHMVYAGATLEYFNKVLMKDTKKIKEFAEFMVEFHYGKQNTKKDKEVELLFQTYINNKKGEDQTEKVLIMKEKTLSFRDEDANYWRYYLSVIPNDILLNELKENFDIKSFNKVQTPSVGMKVFTKNNYELLNQELPVKTQAVFVRKNIKL